MQDVLLFNPNKGELFEGRFLGGVNLNPPRLHISRRTNLISI